MALVASFSSSINAQFVENTTGTLSTTDGVNIGDSNGSLLFRHNVGGTNEIRSYGLNLEIETRDFENILFNTNNGINNLMTIKGDGNIGIGVPDPLRKLQVKGVTNLISPYNGNNFLHFDYASNGNKVRSYGTNLFLETRNNTENIEFRTDNSVKSLMLIKGNGQVGIGTSSMGTHKLAVEGTIGAREIKVEASGWSDFVFENDYELRTLGEVEKHIAEKGHLPEIPSEAEVTENGINLVEMDAKLLQKIEELTLYLIEQNKRMNKLEAKNAQLEKEISSMKNE